MDFNDNNSSKNTALNCSINSHNNYHPISLFNGPILNSNNNVGNSNNLPDFSSDVFGAFDHLHCNLPLFSNIIEIDNELYNPISNFNDNISSNSSNNINNNSNNNSGFNIDEIFILDSFLNSNNIINNNVNNNDDFFHVSSLSASSPDATVNDTPMFFPTLGANMCSFSSSTTCSKEVANVQNNGQAQHVQLQTKCDEYVENSNNNENEKDTKSEKSEKDDDENKKDEDGCEYEEIIRDGKNIKIPLPKIITQQSEASNSSHNIYICSICNKSYKFIGNYRSHARLHTEACFKCKTCNRSFERKSTYEEHLLIHLDQKPFKCNLCEKTFRRQHQHKEHLRTHSSEKGYVCSYDSCYRSFSSKHNLAVHMRIHTGDKPYKCLLCDKRFRQKPALNAHVKACHTLEMQQKGLSRDDINQYCLDRNSKYVRNNTTTTIKD